MVLNAGERDARFEGCGGRPSIHTSYSHRRTHQAYGGRPLSHSHFPFTQVNATLALKVAPCPIHTCSVFGVGGVVVIVCVSDTGMLLNAGERDAWFEGYGGRGPAHFL